ncbi:MAG: hypothetical protein H6631_07775 [Anaerolineaceae bacterium]|nr:hypothetical protein [Anaerolineaceae bacterium]
MSLPNPVAPKSTQLKQPNFPLRATLTPLIIYVLLALVLTWPTVSHLTAYLPGDGGDDPAIAWNVWWVKYALLNRGQSPFITNFMFYPIDINLAFYTLTVLNAVTALPLTLNLGVVAASNLHLFFSLAIGGYGGALLTRYVLVSALFGQPAAARRHFSGNSVLIWLSSTIAGGFYTFASSKLFYVALGQFNIASSHWIPFAVLYILKTHHQPYRLQNPLLAGLFFTLQAWTELTYASFILVFMGLLWLYEGIGFIVRPQTRWPLRIFVRNVVVMGLCFILGLVPILAYMLPDMLAEGDFLVEGSGFADTFSADLVGFFIPTMHHPLWGQLITQSSIQNFDKGQHIYLGGVLLGLLVVAIIECHRQSDLWFWVIATVVFALLALGPAITIDGHATSLTGPFVILQQLPFFKGNRYPSRYSVMLLLSLSVVASFALVWIGQWLAHAAPGKSTAGVGLLLIASLFLCEHLSLPLPQSDMRIPSFYQLIEPQPDPFTVLDIPFAWRNGFRITGALTTQFMFGQFYQTDHQQRLIQGNTSRNPEFKFQYFTQAPIINSLLALETGQSLSPDRFERDKAIASDVLNFFDIRYIVVRSYQYPRPDGSPISQAGVIPYIEQIMPVEKIYDEAGSRVYRVIDAAEPAANLRIETGSPLARLYFGEGWGLLTPNQPITAQRRSVRLLLPFTSGVQHLTLRARLPDFDPDSSRTVTLVLNNWRSEPQSITSDWQDLTFTIPASVAAAGLNDVWLHFSTVSAFPPNHPILDVTALSAGEEVGDFGHIYLNGEEISPNQRGYNVAIIPPQAPPTVENFDTHLDSAASARLAQLLQAGDWPAGAIIAVAAADEPSANLSEAAVLALQALGAQGDLRGCFRCSHVFISQASTRRSWEAGDTLGPVGVTTALGLTEPAAAALIESITITVTD